MKRCSVTCIQNYVRIASSRSFALALVIAAIGCLTCNDGPTGKDTPLPSAANITLRFNGPGYMGNFYHGFLPATDHAIWVENADRKLVKTLALSNTVIEVGPHPPHLDHVPVWTAKSGETLLGIMQQLVPDTVGIPAAYDGVTGASIQLNSGQTDTALTAIWDFTDMNGSTVAEGVYYFCAEVSNIKKDSSDAPDVQAYTLITETASGSVSYPSGEISPAQPGTYILELSALCLY